MRPEPSMLDAGALAWDKQGGLLPAISAMLVKPLYSLR